jgi:hypothetical protein
VLSRCHRGFIASTNTNRLDSSRHPGGPFSILDFATAIKLEQLSEGGVLSLPVKFSVAMGLSSGRRFVFHGIRCMTPSPRRTFKSIPSEKLLACEPIQADNPWAGRAFPRRGVPVAQVGHRPGLHSNSDSSPGSTPILIKGWGRFVISRRRHGIRWLASVVASSSLLWLISVKALPVCHNKTCLDGIEMLRTSSPPDKSCEAKWAMAERSRRWRCSDGSRLSLHHNV